MSSSALMGFLQLTILLAGILQSKVIAVLVGPSGVGLFGIYASLLILVQSVVGMGVTGSGVRQLAVLTTGPEHHVPMATAKMIRALQWTAVAGAMTGAVGLLLFRRQISLWSFGTEEHGNALGFIAFALITVQLSTAQTSVFKGLRRIKTLTLIGIISAILSACSAIALLFLFKERAIAPAYAASGLVSLLVSWFFLRQLHIPRAPVSLQEGWQLSTGLLSLGIGFLVPGLCAAASAYVIRALIAKEEGISSVGLYQSAWMLTTFYAGVVMQAMSTDFLPRLSTTLHDHLHLRRITDEQTKAGLIMTIPGLLLCMMLAPLILRVIYTAEFSAAAALSRWMLLGMMVRASGWPLAYVPLAMNRPLIIASVELISNGVLIILSVIGMRRFGLEGVGMAFLATSCLYTLTLLGVGAHLLGFPWTKSTCRMQGLLYACGGIIFCLVHSNKLEPWRMISASLLITAICLTCGIWAIRALDLVPWLKTVCRKIRIIRQS